MESKSRPENDKQMAESKETETSMMCWENLKDSLGKEPNEDVRELDLAMCFPIFEW